jgi:hypothetical protein
MSDNITLPRDVAERLLLLRELASEYPPGTGLISPEERAALAALEAALAEPVEYRCHIEIEVMPDGFEPDGCVLDGGNPDHCIYAKRYGDKAREHCGEWKPFIRKEDKT